MPNNECPFFAFDCQGFWEVLIVVKNNTFFKNWNQLWRPHLGARGGCPLPLVATPLRWAYY